MHFSTERVMRELAEAALEAPTRADLRRSTLAALQALLGYDFAISWSTRALLEPVTLGVDGDFVRRFEAGLPRYLPELEGPLRLAVTQGVVVDRVIFGPARERFAFYRDIVGPLGARHGLTVAAVARGRTMAVFRLGRGDRRPFRAGDVQRAQRVLSIVRVGELLHAAPPDGASPEEGVRLTPREREMIELFSAGATYADAARLLGVTINTIRDHVRSAYDKLNAASKAEAVARALKSRRD